MHVLQIDHFRGRREQRLDRTFALHLRDVHRSRLLEHLSAATRLVGADRAALVWIDEYGAGLAHPHVVLDLASDPPRRTFSVDLLRRTWADGVPGLVDLPDRQGESILALGDTARSSLSVSLGSDGVRAWFLVADALSPREPATAATLEEFLFLAGECTGVVLHRDLDIPLRTTGDASSAGWRVLDDIRSGRAVEEDERGRLASRFLVVRAVRALLEDDLVVEATALRAQVEGARDALHARADLEHELWHRVLDRVRVPVTRELPEAVVALAEHVEASGHWRGAAELYRLTYGVAAALGAADLSTDAARFLGRVLRRQADWDESMAWYEAARSVAAAVGDARREALVLDGLAAFSIVRGRVPAAREYLDRAETLAKAAGDRGVLAAIYHNRMTVAHTEADLRTAAAYGWMAVRNAEDPVVRAGALAALGGVFLEGRELDAAEAAFEAVSIDDDNTYGLYAMLGLSQVAAFRGDRARFEAGFRALDEGGLAAAPPELRAEALLDRGDGYLSLGLEDEAAEWYGAAARVAAEVDAAEFMVRAEAALERLERLSEEEEDSAVETIPGLLEEEQRVEIVEGLEAIRLGFAGSPR